MSPTSLYFSLGLTNIFQVPDLISYNEVNNNLHIRLDKT